MAKRVAKKSKNTLQFAAAVVVVLAAVLALLAFTFRDGISEQIAKMNAGPEAEEPWSFELGASQVFAAAGNGLATASTTGLQLIDNKGYTVVRHVVSLETPAVAACSHFAVAYDIGGTALRLAYFDGEVKELDAKDPIISVSVSEDGHLAVVTERTGYKGLVTVYDPEQEPVYEWYSGEGYPIGARVSPDGKRMAVITAAGEGGYVRVFSLASEKELGTFQAPNELLFDLCWIGSDQICAISEQRLVFVDHAGRLEGEYAFDGMYITNYSFGGDGFVALGLSKYLSGSASVVLTVGAGGDVLGQKTPDTELKWLCAAGRNVLALYGDRAELYSRTMGRQGYEEEVRGAKMALLRANGDAVLIYATAIAIKSL